MLNEQWAEFVAASSWSFGVCERRLARAMIETAPQGKGPGPAGFQRKALRRSPWCRTRKGRRFCGAFSKFSTVDAPHTQRLEARRERQVRKGSHWGTYCIPGGTVFDVAQVSPLVVWASDFAIFPQTSRHLAGYVGYRCFRFGAAAFRKQPLIARSSPSGRDPATHNVIHRDRKTTAPA